MPSPTCGARTCCCSSGRSGPVLKRASFGYQMRTSDLRVFRYREDKRDTDVIRVSEKQDEKIVAAGDSRYLIKAAVA